MRRDTEADSRRRGLEGLLWGVSVGTERGGEGARRKIAAYPQHGYGLGAALMIELVCLLGLCRNGFSTIYI